MYHSSECGFAVLFFNRTVHRVEIAQYIVAPGTPGSCYFTITPSVTAVAALRNT